MDREAASNNLKEVLTDVINLSDIIKEAKSIKDLIKKDEKLKDLEIYIDNTEKLISNLKESIEKIHESSYKIKPIKEESKTNAVGKIKVVDISKLIDPEHNKRIKETEKNVEDSIVTISDSDDEPIINTKKKRKPSLNNNNISDEEVSISKSILRNGSKVNSVVKKVKFSLDNQEKKKLSEIVASSEESSSDTSSDYVPIARKRKLAPKSKQRHAHTIPIDDKKFYWKCTVELPRVPAEKLKELYGKNTEEKVIQRLTNLKNLKRRRVEKNISTDSDSEDSHKPKRKKVARKKNKDESKSSDELSSLYLSSSSDLEVDEKRKEESKALDAKIDALVSGDTNEELSTVDETAVEDIILDTIPASVSDGKSDEEIEENKSDKGIDEDVEENDKGEKSEIDIEKEKEKKDKDKAESKSDSKSEEEGKENKTKKSRNRSPSSKVSSDSDESDHSTETEKESAKKKVHSGKNKKNKEKENGSSKLSNDSDEDDKSADDDENKENNKKKEDNSSKLSNGSDEDDEIDDNKKNKEKSVKSSKLSKESKEEDSTKEDKQNKNENEKSSDIFNEDDISKKNDQEHKKKNKKTSDDSSEIDESTNNDSEDEDKTVKEDKKNKKENDKSSNASDENDKSKKNEDENKQEKEKISNNSEDDGESKKNKQKKKKKNDGTSSDSEDEESKKKEQKKKKRNEETSSDEDDASKGKERKKRNGGKSSESEEDAKSKKKKSDGRSSESEEDGESKKSDEKKKKKNKASSDESDEDAILKKKEKKIAKSPKNRLLSDSEESTKADSDSDTNKEKKGDKKKKLKKNRVKRLKGSSSEEEYVKSASEQESSSDSEKEEEVKPKPVRRRIKRTKESSSDDDDKSTRKHIRKVWDKDSLAETTKLAEKEERERKARIAEKQKRYNDIFDPQQLESSKLTKVVLDFNEETQEELLAVDKKMVKHLKPHQGKGVQFMWDACFESIDRAKSSPGSGCILAHCMGLGKTLQVITLVHTLMKNVEKSGVKKVLVVCPLSTVLNWVAEFKKWVPEEDEDEIVVMDLVQFKQNKERQYQVREWHRHGGVLILGYDMFRNLSNTQNKRFNKKMRQDFLEALIDPGPDLVICDEGHLLKNEKTSISISMNKLKTLRRIVLTGTPLQNNLKEYFCMVQFVKPNLLGTYKEYLNRFVNPITNGQYTDSTPHDTQVMRRRSHVLHKLLDGIVQRKDYSVLAPFLPPKHEYVLFIRLTPVQVNLYNHYMREFARRSTGTKSSFLFIDFQELQRICTHPRVLLDKSIQNRIAQEKRDWENDDESEGSLKDFIDDESSTSASSSTSNSDNSDNDDISDNGKPKQKKKEKYTRRTRAAVKDGGLDDVVEVVDDSNKEWWSRYTEGDELDNIIHSGKLHLLFEILHQCEQMGDKVLVFSQSLYSLNVIEYFLDKIDESCQTNDASKVAGYSSSWSIGLDYFRIDGSSSCDNRALWCNKFNDPENTRARLFLISTRAGGLGINLVAANRVIIFDVSWNPSHDIQSIYRVYRFGQEKPSYIYRFVTLGTMEMKIYERQVTKQAISKRVIDEQQIDRHYNQNDLAELYKFEPNPEQERPIPLVPRDVLLGELLQKHENLIYKYHEHQSLLENKEEEGLNEEERKAAWEEFENEKQNRNLYAATNNYNAGLSLQGIPMQTIIQCMSNIISREHPTLSPTEIKGVMPQLIQELNSQLAAGELTMYHKVMAEFQVYRDQIMQMQKFKEMYEKQRQQQMMQMGNASNANSSGVPAWATGSRNAAANINPSEVVRIDD